MPKYWYLTAFLFLVACAPAKEQRYTAICQTPGGPLVQRDVSAEYRRDGILKVTGDKGSFYTHSINCLIVEE